MRKVLSTTLVCGLLITLCACGTIDKTTTEGVEPGTVDGSTYMKLELEIHSSASDSWEITEQLKKAIKSNVRFTADKEGNNGKILLIDVEVVHIDKPSSFARFMMGAGAGSDQIVAVVKLMEKESTHTVGKMTIRSEQNRGMSSGVNAAVDGITKELLTRLSLW